MMRPRLGHLLAVVGVVSLVFLLAAPAAAFHKYPKWKCGYHWNKSEFRMRQLIKCQAERKGVGPFKAVRVAKCEAGLNPKAVGGGGLYLGLYQQHKDYWPARAAAHGFAGWSAFNGRANAFVSIGMASNLGWTGHWPVCGYR